MSDTYVSKFDDTSSFIDAAEKLELEQSLIEHSYFPFVREQKEEMPPILSTHLISPKIVEYICSINKREKKGYSSISYTLTRHNKVHRTLSIPHPVPYVFLVKQITENWEDLRHIIDNEHSKIKPQIFGRADPRVIIMNYDTRYEKRVDYLNASIDANYIVRTDIANCFPSIYSHAISWALDEKWSKEFELLEKAVMLCSRKESNGVPIGPATSNIFCEVILEKVDKKLEEKQYTFTRYIDDYVCFCNTKEDAEQFIIDLAQLLEVYKLKLNIQKTTIDTLPAPISPIWLNELNCFNLPELLDDSSEKDQYIFIEKSFSFLDIALDLNTRTPDASILKYAVKRVVKNSNNYIDIKLVERIVGLCKNCTILLPTINSWIGDGALDIATDNLKRLLENILSQAILNHESDTMSWCLYYMYKLDIIPSEETIENIVETCDCISLTILYKCYPDTKAKIQEYVNSIIKNNNSYEADESWLLLYQFFLDGSIDRVYQSESNDQKVFDFLKKEKVTFIDLTLDQQRPQAVPDSTATEAAE